MFSRYCRLFVGDKEAIEKYRTAIERASESFDECSQFWVDTIKFEFQFNSLDAAKILLEKVFKTKMKETVKFLDSVFEMFENFGKTDVCEMIDAAKQRYLKGLFINLNFLLDIQVPRFRKSGCRWL